MQLILDQQLAPRTGWAGVVRRGQRLRIVEVDGGQIGDFVVFNATNTRERFDQGRTKANQGRIFISTVSLRRIRVGGIGRDATTAGLDSMTALPVPNAETSVASSAIGSNCM